jgi:hypothetical protein
VESGRKQYLEFPGFTVEEGVYRPKAGWTFTKIKNGTFFLARTGTDMIITPCECALETVVAVIKQPTRDRPGTSRRFGVKTKTAASV